MKARVLCLILPVGIFAAGKDEFVNVSGRGHIKTPPNQVLLCLGVSKIDKLADSAVVATTRVANRLVATCKAHGIADKDIETQANTLERAYRVSQDTSTYLGIKSVVLYNITLNKVDSVNALLNALHSNGMNEFSAFVFRHTRQDSLKRAASILAMRDAYENASALAVTSGRKIKNLLNASYEKPSDFSMRPNMNRDYFYASGMGAGAPSEKPDLEYFKIKPGQLEIEIEVFAKYEMK